MHQLVYKISQNCKKKIATFPEPKVTSSTCFSRPTVQNLKNYSIYNAVKPIKSANPQSGEAGTNDGIYFYTF